MNVSEYTKKIVEEIHNTLSLISDSDTDALADAIIGANRIFVAGAGRSGLMMKAFAMRLMHMGFTVYVVGETVTPGISRGDLFIIGSGSGETASLVSMGCKAVAAGAGLAVVTIFPESSLGKKATTIVKVSAPTPKTNRSAEASSIQPMGSLFEQSLLLILDALILRLMEKRSIDTDAMFARHANLE